MSEFLRGAQNDREKQAATFAQIMRQAFRRDVSKNTRESGNISRVVSDDKCPAYKELYTIGRVRIWMRGQPMSVGPPIYACESKPFGGSISRGALSFI